jgi:uncharacterized membrane protein
MDMAARELLIVGCAVASGLMAGFFYAFSVCVMKALGKLPPTQGIAAMQTINVVVINPVFLTVFLGTAVASGVAFVGALMLVHMPGAPLVLAGSLLYVLGTFGVTMVFNVPRNNRLAGMASASAEAPAYWAEYLSRWTMWNHVRMFAALAAGLLFTLALRSLT